MAEARSRTEIGVAALCNRAYRDDERYQDGPLQGERTIDNVVGALLVAEQQHNERELLRIVRRNLGG